MNSNPPRPLLVSNRGHKIRDSYIQLGMRNKNVNLNHLTTFPLQLYACNIHGP